MSSVATTSTTVNVPCEHVNHFSRELSNSISSPAVKPMSRPLPTALSDRSAESINGKLSARAANCRYVS